jgi:hypothetical protein
MVELWTQTHLVAQFSSMHFCIMAMESLQRLPDLSCYYVV